MGDSDNAFQDALAPKKKRASETPRLKPWVEKHRPRKMSDIASQSEVVNTLTACMRDWTLPHLLFYGPPGTGKTSTILAMAKQMFAGDFKKRVLELNASDDRGIAVIRDKVKMFAKGAVSKRGSAGQRLPPFKLIILDEADSLTSAAQDALRRTMEKYSKVTRFCLICNYVSRIAGPISSRCAKFRFKPLPAEAMRDQLRIVAKKEGVPLTDEVMEQLMTCSGGDMRKAITGLQSCWQLYGENMSVDAVNELSGDIPSSYIDELWAVVVSNKDIDKAVEKVDDLVALGFSASMIVAKLQQKTVESEDLSELQMAFACQKFAEADRRLADRTDEHLVLLDTACYLAQIVIDPPTVAMRQG